MFVNPEPLPSRRTLACTLGSMMPAAAVCNTPDDTTSEEQQMAALMLLSVTWECPADGGRGVRMRA